MITPTTNSKLWRVEFEQHFGELTKTAVVNYIFIGEAGIRIYYSHHVTYSRQVPTGDWERGISVRQSMGAALRSTIEANVWSEMWECSRDPKDAVRILPAAPDSPVQEFENDLQ